MYGEKLKFLNFFMHYLNVFFSQNTNLENLEAKLDELQSKYDELNLRHEALLRQQSRNSGQFEDQTSFGGCGNAEQKSSSRDDVARRVISYIKKITILTGFKRARKQPQTS